MKKIRLIALILTMLMLLQIVPAIAETAGDVIITPAEDSYIMGGSRWKNKNYGSSSNLLFGSAYDRTAIMKFDISDVELSLYNGALLDITFCAASDKGYIEAYVVEDNWTEDKVTYSNFSADYSFLVSSAVSKGPEQHLSLTLNKVLQSAKENGKKTICIALKSDYGCISVFSSEASDPSKRPFLTLTEENAYIKDQYDFEFPVVTANQIKSDLENLVAKGHPYMYADKATFDKLREYAFGKDEFLTKQYSILKAEADAILDAPIRNIDKYLGATDGYLQEGINISNDIMRLALVYQMEGDVRYAQRAYDQVEYLCQLESWGLNQLIDRSQLYIGIALCYDWLYDWLSAEQKENISTRTKELTLEMLLDVHKNPSKSEYKGTFHQMLFSGQNHGIVNNATTFILAMALADSDVDFASELMAESFNFIITPLLPFYPDGDWEEGASYWVMAGPFASRFLQALNFALGHCYGYEKVGFVEKMADYPIYSSSDIAALVSGNANFGFKLDYDACYFLIGELGNNKTLQAYAIDKMKKKNVADTLNFVTYDPEESYDVGSLSMNLDKRFRRAGTAIMRSSFEGTQNTYVGMISRPKPRMDTMLDRGTLAFDALGERWITNHGKEVYYAGNVTEERWTWYRNRPESQSCVLINPSEYRGQEMVYVDGINEFESGAGGSFAIADLTPSYSISAKSFKRGIQLTDSRQVFVVQDEIKLLKPSEIYSFFNVYDAEIELLSDGKSAILRKNNKKVYVTVDCNTEFKLGKMFAEPLPGTAIPASTKPNTPNPDFMKLYLYFKDAEEANVRVCFIPYLCEEELASVTCTDFVPMSEWVVQSELKATPMLDDIKVNGVSINGFDKYNRCYDVTKELSASDVEVIYDHSKYDVNISKETKTGALNILVIDKLDDKNINSYSLAVPVVPKPSWVDTSNMSVLPITKTVAREDEKQNPIGHLYDDDLSTRWAAEGAGTIMTIDLDKPHKLGCMAASIYLGDRRRQSFDVAVSLDGKTWTNVGRFRSSGVTTELEYYDLKNLEAKHVKITWNSNSEGAWNSITELKFYGK